MNLGIEIIQSKYKPFCKSTLSHTQSLEGQILVNYTTEKRGLKVQIKNPANELTLPLENKEFELNTYKSTVELIKNSKITEMISK